MGEGVVWSRAIEGKTGGSPAELCQDASRESYEGEVEREFL